MLSWRDALFDTFDRYIFNDLPTHLLHVNRMQLVTREDIRKTFLPQMEKVTEAVFKEHVQSWGVADKGYKIEVDIRDMIRKSIRYAILSHRWGTKEPSFRDISKARGRRWKMPSGLGTQKMLKFCGKAREYGCEYAWSDTCCIDKTSSAELEEAIRSMFRWYQNAEVCIVYLAQSSALEDFEKEEWFTRGWTLQELLAPRRLKFYGKNWQPLCNHTSNDKIVADVQNAITRVTRIPQKEIQSFQPGCGRVFEKMIWASGRKTTRTEDIAYSLIGIFDITMPVAYGEGRWAFHRLMEIIAQKSADSGFFAWAGSPSPYSLVLPNAPSCYSTSLWNSREELSSDVSFTLTKEGLQVELLVVGVTMIPPLPYGPNGTLSTSGDHPLEMIPVTFSPKWSSRRGTTKEIISTCTTAREINTCRAWAVGIVYGYTKISDGYTGKLYGGRTYFCLLLGKLMNNSKWVKLRTKEALTCTCEHTVIEPVVGVCLQHRC